MTSVPHIDNLVCATDKGRRKQIRSEVRACHHEVWHHAASAHREQIERRMRELDEQVEAKAREQYRQRVIYPRDECYQLDGATYISAEAFEGILGREQTHYMLWKNIGVDDRTAAYWESPDVMNYLLECSIDDGDGGECCFTDAQSIDYARSCTFTPAEMLLRQGADKCVGHAADDGLNYALYGHPDVDVAECAGHAVFLSSRNPSRAVRAEYRGDTWIMQAFERYRPWGIPVRFDWRDVPREQFDSDYRCRFLAARSAFDCAVTWVDAEAW